MKTLFIAGTVLGAVLASVGTANATPSVCDAVAGNLVANCGFEANHGAFPNLWTTDAGYDLEAGGFNRVLFDPPGSNSGSNYLQFGNYAREGYAGLSQDLSTVSGNTYTESFYYRNGSPGGSGESFEATINDVVEFSTDGSGDTGHWTFETFTFTATGSATKMGFLAYNDPGEFYLDDVVVKAKGTSVPEPMSLSLLGTGLIAAGFFRRRKPKVV